MLKEERCAGLFEPCFDKVTHYLEDPDYIKQPVPLCDKHWNWTMDLEARLNAEPDFAKAFKEAMDEVVKAELQ